MTFRSVSVEVSQRYPIPKKVLCLPEKVAKQQLKSLNFEYEKNWDEGQVQGLLKTVQLKMNIFTVPKIHELTLITKLNLSL